VLHNPLKKILKKKIATSPFRLVIG